MRDSMSASSIKIVLVACLCFPESIQPFQWNLRNSRQTYRWHSGEGVVQKLATVQSPSFGWRPSNTRGFRVMSQQKAAECEESVGTPVDDGELWTSYVDALSLTVQDTRVRKNSSFEAMHKVIDYLKSSKKYLPPPLTNSLGEKFYEDMREQKREFVKMMNISHSEYDFASRSLVYLGDSCAKQRNPLPLACAWYKMREIGLIPHEKSISTYMYVMGLDRQLRDILVEVASVHAMCFEPNEKTTTLRIKAFLDQHKLQEAERILATLPEKADKKEWKKLRTFMPFIEYYCADNDVSSILRMLQAMVASPGVILDANAYGLAIGTLAKNSCFNYGASPIDGAIDFGLSHSSGPPLFDEIMSKMADDILELTEDSVRQIQTGFAASGSIEGADTDVAIEAVNTTISTPSKTLAGRVTVDATTAKCSTTGVKLRLFKLDDFQRQHVHDTLLDMALIQYQEFTKTLNAKVKVEIVENDDQEFGLKQLAKFSNWLDTREGKPFTAIVDGANVGYFGHPQLHYSQVKLVVDELEQMGERPLVIMPMKYMSKKFHLSRPKSVQVLTDKSSEVLDELIAMEKIYEVPQRCLDDYYWMLASVSNQTVARQQADLSVSVEGGDGRFPGLRPMLVTNDQMRDHRLDLLKPREFRRWCSCHIVNYDMSIYEDGEWGNRTAEFAPADFFSREIQGNPHDAGDALVWHVPVTEWGENDRFCLWIQR